MSSKLLCVIIGIFNLIFNEEDVKISDDNLSSQQCYFSQPSLWNHRMCCTLLHDWPYQLNKFYLISNKSLKRFFTKGEHNKCENIENFLSSLSIFTSDESYNPDIVQIEELKINYHGYSTQKKNYSVSLSRETCRLKQNSNVKDRMICAKYIILLMNEIPIGEANMMNYTLLVKWLFQKLHSETNQKYVDFFPKGW